MLPSRKAARYDGNFNFSTHIPQIQNLDVMLSLSPCSFQLLWNYKLNLTTDPKFESVATEVCRSTIAEVSATGRQVAKIPAVAAKDCLLPSTTFLGQGVQ